MKTNNYIRQGWEVGSWLMSWDATTGYFKAMVIGICGGDWIVIQKKWMGYTMTRKANRFYFDVRPLPGEISKMVHILYPNSDQ